MQGHRRGSHPQAVDDGTSAEGLRDSGPPTKKGDRRLTGSIRTATRPVLGVGGGLIDLTTRDHQSDQLAALLAWTPFNLVLTEGIEIDGRLFILRLDTLVVANCKSFEEVQQLIKQQLLFQYNQQQYKELVNKLVMNTDLAEMERFTEFCVNQAYKRWGQS